MTTYEQGEVILVPFPFSDLSGIKRRPALVLAVIEKRQELLCLMLTSGIAVKTTFDQQVKSWKEAGLLKPTAAKLNRLFTVSYPIVLKKLGQIESKEFKEILSKVVAILIKGNN